MSPFVDSCRVRLVRLLGPFGDNVSSRDIRLYVASGSLMSLTRVVDSYN